jgi:diguanylate cyclase (GGDEF)-like protein
MWGISEEFLARRPSLREIIISNRGKGIFDIPEERFDQYLDEREAAAKKATGIPEEFHRKDGIVYQYQCLALPDGGRMLTYFNITRHKDTQDRLAKTLEEVRELANRDPLTGLPNLRMLQESFLNIIAKSRRNCWKTAIMFIDLDGFKVVNDSYGHIVGDMVLKMVAHRLSKTVREFDILGRIGGDEFLIVQTEVHDNSAVVNVAERILKQLENPFELAGKIIKVGASIGISIYPTHGDNLKALIKKADNAMYKAKVLGKQSYTFFDSQV